MATASPRLEARAIDPSQADTIRGALDEGRHVGLSVTGEGAVAAVIVGADHDTVNALASAVNDVPVNVAPFGNAPGEFDLGSLDVDVDVDVDVEAPIAPAPLERLEFPTSKNLVSAELGADGVVTVTFKDGKVYRYANFTPALMADWKAAKSAGSWFHTNVRTKSDRHPVVAD